MVHGPGEEYDVSPPPLLRAAAKAWLPLRAPEGDSETPGSLCLRRCPCHYPQSMRKMLAAVSRVLSGAAQKPVSWREPPGIWRERGRGWRTRRAGRALARGVAVTMAPRCYRSREPLFCSRRCGPVLAWGGAAAGLPAPTGIGVGALRWPHGDQPRLRARG